ncbi:MAG TPA: lipocalin-like domain-containing protein [Acidimicrobiales bacterium]|nr:lipocalin-like domain-containing protein [Acidimicrobiales bacterium]
MTGGDRSADADQQRRLVGTYRVLSVESTAEDGEVDRPFGDRPDGYIAYTPEGRFLVVLARRDRPLFADGDILGGTDQDRAAAFLSASAFCGRAEVRDGKLLHMLEASTFQNWKGTVQVREFEVAGDHLTLRTPAIKMNGKLRTNVLRLVRVAADEPGGPGEPGEPGERGGPGGPAAGRAGAGGGGRDG